MRTCESTATPFRPLGALARGLSPAASSIAVSSIIQPRYTGGRKPAPLKLPGELRDDAPFTRRGRTGQRKRERVLDGQGGLGSHRCTLQLRWAKPDHGTRTYVNSRRLSFRECDVSPRSYYGFSGFDSRWGRLGSACFWLDRSAGGSVAPRRRSIRLRASGRMPLFP